MNPVADFNNQGFVLLPRAFNGADCRDLDCFNRLWKYRQPGLTRLTIDDLETGRRILLDDAPNALRHKPYKINDVYLESLTLRSLLATMGPMLQDLLGTTSQLAVCNSLHFERGSQQEIHSDEFYMPGKAPGGLIAFWIALEDVYPDAGPLIYYPGSHKIDRPFDFNAMAPAERIARTRDATDYYLKELGRLGYMPQTNAGMQRGDVFVWHERLLHGGEKIQNMLRTRKSVVIHCWKREHTPGTTLRINDSMAWFVRDHQPVSDTTPGIQRV